MLTVHFPDFHLIPTTGALGPESFAFDFYGDGPFTGLSDGRIVKWIANESRWMDFAVTTPTRYTIISPFHFPLLLGMYLHNKPRVFEFVL